MPLIDTGLASPVDLRTTWTLDDVYDALEALTVARENQRRLTPPPGGSGGR